MPDYARLALAVVGMTGLVVLWVTVISPFVTLWWCR